MAIEDALKVLNRLKVRRVIRDYAIIGGVAAAAYMYPMYTLDMDILVKVESDEDFVRVFRSVAAVADKVEGLHHVIAGTPVQLLPTTIGPLYAETLVTARRASVGNTRTKIARPEYLAVMFLVANRPHDRVRISVLLPELDKRQLQTLVRRYDDEERTLSRRLKGIRQASL